MIQAWQARLVAVWFVMFRRGRCGKARLCPARQGPAPQGRPGAVVHGVVRLGRVGLGRRVMAGLRPGEAWQRRVLHGGAG